MKSGTLFNQGEIVIVPFPFSDLSSIRQRPVLVLSNLVYNKNCEDIITCGITSNLKDTKYSVLVDKENMFEGLIPIKSRIKADKLFTLNKNIVIKKLGRINKNTFNKVKDELFKLV
ncbi:MAG: type II toxin-antitoxin system PemK/MazF family toxin [Candidatus Nanoarchaeia archaeon]|nr:type II toxin-antitoxin system PemK/MazF family toxin [Candidatus Nanoarchaeia archaeon]MDD5740587.1 type II toxin-antitoxin system PemK/MazF family toxin [Candidatus Nanoarchaeia archaeon]